MNWISILAQVGDVPVVPMPENIKATSFWEDFKGLGFDEVVAKLANGLVSFAFKLAAAILVFYVGRFLIRKLYKWVFKIMTHRSVDASLTTFTLSLIKISLYFILIITVVGILGIETSSFIAIFASAGVAVGMALSGTLQNFAGGVLILLLKPYKVGDFIEAQGYSGTVKSIQLFHTVINTIDNKAIIIPNGALSNSSVNNYSLEEYRRVDWNISLAYGTDIEKAKAAILDILNEDDRVLEIDEETGLVKEPENTILVGIKKKVNRKPFVALKEMGDSAIVLTVRAWTRQSDYWNLYFHINETLYTRLPELGFSFPFPQLDVHLDKITTPAE